MKDQAGMSSLLRVRLQKQALISRYIRADNAASWREVLLTIVPLAALWWAIVASLGDSWLLTGVLMLLLSLFYMRVLVLMHECGHGSLFRSQRLNRALGFLFGVLSGMPQYVWSVHHNFHHANNGNWEKYRGPLTTPSVDEYAAMGQGGQRRYRYSRSIALAPLGGFLYLIFNPRYTWLRGSLGLLIHVVRAKSAQPAVSIREHAACYRTRYWASLREYQHMLWNNLVLLGAWALMCWLVGPAVFFGIYLVTVSLAGGAGIAIFTVQHNFEHSYAADSARWDYDQGAIAGTSFLVLPRWLNWFTANISYHHIHHLSSRIPSYRLAACHNENRELFDDVTRLRLAQIPGALKCILWDVRAQRIISVAEYLRQRAQAA